MSGPGGVSRWRMLLRSFAVQGSWNYQTLIGTGLAFVLAPALRRAYAGDPEGLKAATARHLELFNSHPYLATVAAGALARLEEERLPPETIVRFKAAVRGSLGSLGDRLVWLMWRPACAVLGISLVLAGFAWWVAVGAFLVAYNALHLWMRAWGLKVGLRDGLNIGRTLRDLPFQRLGDRAGDAGSFLAGFAATVAAGGMAVGGGGGTGERLLVLALGIAAAAAGIALGRRVRAVAALLLLAVLVAGTVLAHLG
ncbi:MAG TPA: PTS system mannose/fructose/sorbose family transporter subunit IID [Longimicrobium sp.]|nr:PTS system mannose/fructose/sorbose family transporter subunit IID [Longimicrobium sp.]